MLKQHNEIEDVMNSAMHIKLPEMCKQIFSTSAGRRRHSPLSDLRSLLVVSEDPSLSKILSQPPVEHFRSDGPHWGMLFSFEDPWTVL